ncbi:FAD-dependent oxidoreductase [Candidatus Saccharibacteria bacterium]|nr:FAD-dependent oxidoreductase [Candidatus Saccharibacteria bacterium]
MNFTTSSMAVATKTKILDVAIIGSGPAAFTAAIYAARENLSAAVYEREAIGGLTSTISKIENYPGFSGTGAALMQHMRAQAESFGAATEYGECTAVKKLKNHFELTIDDLPIKAKTVIIATGSDRRKLGIPGEDLPAVSYCATCDGPLVTGKKVIVIGGGNSAVQESFYLLKYAKSVTIISRSGLSSNDVLKERVAKEPRITVITGFSPVEFIAKNGKFSGVKCSSKNNTTETFPADAAFIFIGMVPATSFLPKEILETDGSVKTKPDFSTDIPGLFAAGDCRAGNIKQTIVAAGEGASAAVSAGKYLENLEK